MTTNIAYCLSLFTPCGAWIQGNLTPSPSIPGQLLYFIPGVACLGRLLVHGSPPAVSRTALFSLPLWVPPQCMPGNIAVRFSEGVPYPTPFTPSNLDVNSFLFSSFPQIFIPHELQLVNGHFISNLCSLSSLVHSNLGSQALLGGEG